MIVKPFLLASLLSISLLTVSCSNSSMQERRAYLSPEANAVRVIKQLPPNCQPVGVVEGWGAAQASGKTVWTFAMNDLRNKAAAQGITTVVLERYKHNNDGNVLSVKVYGKLMRCDGAARAQRPQPSNGADNTYGSVRPTPPPTTGGDVGKPQPTTEPKPANNGTTPPPVEPPGEEF
ncbi:DUF4156 domain-containing protein [Myxococcota bacterium]|nr:DUF4156 domain-containing protein [Myxococcota bacterium]MBU1537002.1 DUF4156 domain-containing protein [Myxococcota bacterium]